MKPRYLLVMFLAINKLDNALRSLILHLKLRFMNNINDKLIFFEFRITYLQQNKMVFKQLARNDKIQYPWSNSYSIFKL
jgi:hypothetical protein